MLAAVRANAVNGHKHSLGNPSRKDGRVRFFLRDLSICLILMTEAENVPRPVPSVVVLPRAPPHRSLQVPRYRLFH